MLRGPLEEELWGPNAFGICTIQATAWASALDLAYFLLFLVRSSVICDLLQDFEPFGPLEVSFVALGRFETRQKNTIKPSFSSSLRHLSCGSMS